MYITRVERNFEAAHSNGPPEGRCYTMHGHSWLVTVEVSMKNDKLDEYAWSIDFGDLKKAIDKYDHQTLNTFFDSPSAENIAAAIYNDVQTKIGERGLVSYVKIEEGHGNTLIYTGPDDSSCTCGKYECTD